jgi:hypothetical protein
VAKPITSSIRRGGSALLPKWEKRSQVSVANSTESPRGWSNKSVDALIAVTGALD